MPKRIPEDTPIPLPVADLVQRWGKAVRAQRQARKIPMRDFAHRINASLNTLQRIERGEHSVQAATYLTAMMALGLMEQFCPAPDSALMLSSVERVRPPKSKGDDDYF
jgi:ribosome-binding protein aMBF1 (putative translation factor)